MSVLHNHTKAQLSRAAIARLHVSMRHLMLRGGYKPLGASGETMIQSMLTLQPEIYGSMVDSERVELDGMHYIFQRLPRGIEACRYIHLIAREGYENDAFEPIIPSKRRRRCYRVDDEQMYIEMTRGRSDIYDVLTHLTFMFMEAEKIRKNALDHHDQLNRAWTMLEDIVVNKQEVDPAVGISYLSTLLARPYEEVKAAYKLFDKTDEVSSLFDIVYYLGKNSLDEYLDGKAREITFSSTLRDVIGLHIYGESWARKIKDFLYRKEWLDREIHIISANMHSIMNSLYAEDALGTDDFMQTMEQLSKSENQELRDKVREYALKHGMHEIHDNSGTNISVQLFDGDRIKGRNGSLYEGKIIFVMDYAFGEQAFETLDELLRPHKGHDDSRTLLNIASINIMGKAGILQGEKGDIMIPTAHVFEGSTDNYPVDNKICLEDLTDQGMAVYTGPMITVLGTSLQNKDILRYFLKSSWQAIGLEMEGGHYQKAIQAASKIRKVIRDDIPLRYAYYASDNPLQTGSTLSSGSLGIDGVRPTYTITRSILNAIAETC